jgi:subtilisin family serine protease
MKKSLLAAVLIVFPSFMFAGGVTRPYLVGTRGPARQAATRVLNDDLAPRSDRGDVVAFDIVDAFAVQLTDDEVARLWHSASVKYVEPDLELHALDMPRRARAIAPMQVRNLDGQTIPYGVPMVHADSVGSVSSKRGSGINVAVLDTGIDITHPDLQAAYAGGFNTFYGSTKYPNEPQKPIDDFGHGTHVSGTIAATDNSFGVVGVAPSVKLWAVRVLRANGTGASGPESNIVAGIQWVVNKKQELGGDWIISMSLGSCQPGITEQTALNIAIANGILVVAAAGNHDSTSPDVCDGTTDNGYSVSYPAAFPGVVAVAAVDASANVADFSNFGPEVALAAPGVDVLSTVRVGTGSLAFVQPSTAPRVLGSGLTGSPFGSMTGKFVDCSLGSTSADFPASVSGNIALIKRGTSTFATKAKNAKAAGATAVVIYNKDDSGLSFTLQGDPADANYAWPLTVAIPLGAGQALLSQPNATLVVSNQKDDYGIEQGTSMATPHVASVAALVWSLAPQVTADQVKQALLAGGRDLGAPGVDIHYGYGLVDAWGAALRLVPSLFPPSNLAGRKILRRGGH